MTSETRTKQSILAMPSHRCPWPNCPFHVYQFACEEHWTRLPAPARRAIIAELKAMAARGQKRPSPALHAAFIEGLKQVIEIASPGRLEERQAERFERRAEAFYKATGMLRPGKDNPAAAGSTHTDEERKVAFAKWSKENPG